MNSHSYVIVDSKKSKILKIYQYLGVPFLYIYKNKWSVVKFSEASSQSMTLTRNILNRELQLKVSGIYSSKKVMRVFSVITRYSSKCAKRTSAGQPAPRISRMYAHAN